MLVEQTHCEVGVEVVGEHEHSDLGLRAAEFLGGDKTLSVCVGGILMSMIATSGCVSSTRRRLFRRTSRSDNVDFGLSAAARLLAEECLVVGDYDPHGNSARIVTRPFSPCSR